MTRDQAATVILNRVLDDEGGIGQVAGEAWVTRFGQTPQWLQDFGFTAPETRDEAMANYKTWLVRTRLIGLCDEPDSLAWGVIDWAVNSGHRPAIVALQRALGVPADGVLGPETQQALEQSDRLHAAARVVAARARHYGKIVTGDAARYGRYAHGWMNRLAGHIEALV